MAELMASDPGDIRAAGWVVGAHNDYRQFGIPHTFWLFTRGNQCAKGEGRTDGLALDMVRRDAGLMPVRPVGSDECGDCRERIRAACRCEDHLRIYEEQQRADRAERVLGSIRDALAGASGMTPADQLALDDVEAKCAAVLDPDPNA